MLKKILVALVLIIIVFVIVVATRPANFRIARSTTIAAPAELAFAQVSGNQQTGASVRLFRPARAGRGSLPRAPLKRKGSKSHPQTNL